MSLEDFSNAVAAWGDKRRIDAEKSRAAYAHVANTMPESPKLLRVMELVNEYRRLQLCLMGISPAPTSDEDLKAILELFVSTRQELDKELETNG